MKKQGKVLPYSFEREGGSADTLILDLWLPEFSEHKLLLFLSHQLVVIYYDSHRRRVKGAMQLNGKGTWLRTAIPNSDLHYVWPWHVASQGLSFFMWKATLSETLSIPHDLWIEGLRLLLSSPPVGGAVITWWPLSWQKCLKMNN